MAERRDPPTWAGEALAYSIGRVRANSDLADFPEIAKDGAWTQLPHGGWVGGHWTGLLWLAYAHSGDQALAAEARRWTERLLPRQDDASTHDLGFLFQLSCILGGRLTGDDALARPALQAARTLSRRFNEQGKYLQAWGPPTGTPEQRGRAIVDTMMNLYLLHWATRTTGDPLFARQATEHAHTVLRCQVRPDWSTAHVIDFDPDSGQFLRQETHQGLSATSCWSRGQAWAIYGFTESFRWTGHADFLSAARGLAGYVLHHLPPDHVPYWDYDSQLIPDDVRDSSAAAIAASALLLLSSVETDAGQATRWRSAGTAMLAALWQGYSSRKSNEPCILLHGTRSKPHGLLDHGLIYGDYYFVEGLTRLLAPHRLPF